MIFAIADHVKQIIEHTKTQTRRSSHRYRVGRLYSIQPKRTAKAIPDGKILITNKRMESFYVDWISELDAKQEGAYTPEQYERLYSEIHPNWKIRYAYTFRFLPNEEILKTKRANLKRKKVVRITFSLTKDFDRTTYFSESELDKLAMEVYQKIGYKPQLEQKFVHAFVPRPRRPEDETAITGKIRR